MYSKSYGRLIWPCAQTHTSHVHPPSHKSYMTTHKRDNRQKGLLHLSDSDSVYLRNACWGKHLYNVSLDRSSPDVLTHFRECRSAAWYGAHLDCSVRHTITWRPPLSLSLQRIQCNFTAILLKINNPGFSFPKKTTTKNMFQCPQTPHPPPASSTKV